MIQTVHLIIKAGNLFIFFWLGEFVGVRRRNWYNIVKFVILLIFYDSMVFSEWICSYWMGSGGESYVVHRWWPLSNRRLCCSTASQFFRCTLFWSCYYFFLFLLCEILVFFVIWVLLSQLMPGYSNTIFFHRPSSFTVSLVFSYFKILLSLACVLGKAKCWSLIYAVWSIDSNGHLLKEEARQVKNFSEISKILREWLYGPKSGLMFGSTIWYCSNKCKWFLCCLFGELSDFQPYILCMWDLVI